LDDTAEREPGAKVSGERDIFNRVEQQKLHAGCGKIAG